MRLSTEDESQDKVLYEGSVTAFVVSGLEEYVMYSFTVVSVNVKYSWTSTPVVAMETTHPAGIFQWSIKWILISVAKVTHSISVVILYFSNSSHSSLASMQA